MSPVVVVVVVVVVAAAGFLSAVPLQTLSTV